MLIITRKQGESFMLGDDIEIIIAEVNGDRARIAINAPRDVKVLRKELVEAMELNKEAAEASVAPSPATLMGFATQLKNKKE